MICLSNIGKPGEELFKRIMGGRNYSIEDVRDVPFYQCKDIDFVLTSFKAEKLSTTIKFSNLADNADLKAN